MVERASSRFDVGSKQFARNKQKENNDGEDNDDEDNTTSPSSGPSPGPGAYTRALANHTHILVFALVQRNLAYLESFLRSVSDPDSPQYGQYMSNEEVQQRSTIDDQPYFLDTSHLHSTLHPFYSPVTPFLPSCLPSSFFTSFSCLV